jgi:hypothetical protein
MSTPLPGLRRATGYQPAARAAHARCGNTRLYELLAAREVEADVDGHSRKITVHATRRYLTDQERRKRMRKILKTRNHPDEDGDDPIDADPMRFIIARSKFGSAPAAL